MKLNGKSIFGLLLILTLTIGFTSCGAKKHGPCESYGNKSAR